VIYGLVSLSLSRGLSFRQEYVFPRPAACADRHPAEASTNAPTIAPYAKWATIVSGGHEFWIEVPLSSQLLQEEAARLVRLAAFLVDPHPVFLVTNALPPFHRAVGRARVPTELLGPGPGLVQRFGAGALTVSPVTVDRCRRASPERHR
jgi:hypothetical protein